jgi:hypothetical protein
MVLFLLTACQPGREDAELVSEQRCGDGVCDGPENAAGCPADCAGIAEGTDDNDRMGDHAADGANASAPNDPPGENASEIYIEVFIEVSVSRADGEGDCGVPPWGVDHIDGGDFTCPPPKYWFGYDLQATGHQQLDLVPQGEGWVFSPRSSGGGTYQTARHWSDGQRICTPASIQAEPFALSISGAAADAEIVLEIDARPVELAQWECNGSYAYDRETTLLLLDWGMAVSGSYDNLSTLLEQSDRISGSRYRHVFALDTNPSPMNRDHVEVEVQFSCMTLSQDGSTSVESACPW